MYNKSSSEKLAAHASLATLQYKFIFISQTKLNFQSDLNDQINSVHSSVDNLLLLFSQTALYWISTAVYPKQLFAQKLKLLPNLSNVPYLSVCKLLHLNRKNVKLY